MCDMAKEIGKEIIKQGYSDIAPAVKETAGIIATISGFFNDVALYPLQKARINFQYKLQNFEKDLEEKYNKIPETNRIEPPISILGPTIEGLKYTIDETELREMFVNLLASSMDSSKVKSCHPSYAEIIKQLSKLDATIINSFFFPIDSYPISRIFFSYKGQVGSFMGVMPKIFSHYFYEFGEPFLVSSSLENLSRLGLISFDFNSFVAENSIYEKDKNHPYVQEIYDKLEGGKNNIIISSSNGILKITDFGRNFINTCVDINKIMEEHANAH